MGRGLGVQGKGYISRGPRTTGEAGGGGLGLRGGGDQEAGGEEWGSGGRSPGT